MQEQVAQRMLDMQDAVMERFYEAVEAVSYDQHMDPPDLQTGAAAAPAKVPMKPKGKRNLVKVILDFLRR